MTTPSSAATTRFRHMSDGDDARDLAFDWDAGEQIVKRDLVITADYDVRLATGLIAWLTNYETMDADEPMTPEQQAVMSR
jgi:hypothetical protein